ncbi:hypothetical protein Ade02nite_11920 [Paractinoplanes deccanensis]|uniref:STAS domain-containing protein n=1 Tax=Paractinoplanes deccanensis TaxID=113561 RepID=A0ABQ3XXT4_9ACTN|nr:STAS domain-containing protein [Actinoplanes deccanensis]GID72551.1 hypothetical protein Ade02nite_11920 [Actinoplanes deccanensis]
MGRFEARTSEEAGEARVILSGDCDLSVQDELVTVLLAAVDGHERVVVDLAAVGFLDSSGVHSLVTAHHTARERGGRVIVAGATGAVATVLDITGVATLLGEGAAVAAEEPPAAERGTGG